MSDEVVVSKRGGKGRLNVERAIQSLLGNPTVRAAAIECGLNERTLYRWLKQPSFLSAYNAAKAELMAATSNRLLTASMGAVETLVSISSNSAATESARVASASKVIELAIRTSTLESIQSRLSELERGNEE
jgi:transposase-like protein